MEGIAGRIVFLVVLTVLAGSLGGWAGQSLGAPVALAIAGALLAAVAATAVDRWRGERLLDWLRGPLDRPAPRQGGFWGELAYRAERALLARDQRVLAEREKLRQFLSAIEASPNGVLLLDANQQIEWCNAVAAAHFGLDPVRDQRQRITNLLRAPAFVAYLQEGRFEQPVSIPGRSGHGTLSVGVQRYGDGQMLLLSQDITERERAETMRRDFVANVSHEIRTPLTVLAGFVETLASLPLSPPERDRVLALMEQQTTRMQALVADLLTLAQLEGSPRPATDEWVPVAALLQRALADGQALSGGRHVIELVADAAEFAAEGAAVAGAAGELHSALGNLVTNAVRYTPEGGRIVLAWLPRADGGAQLEVTDTGPGIAREHLPRLTERFYRVDSGRSRDTGGTGLGLAIVKHVIQRHGGEIDIQSEPGKGSCFRLVLPPARVRLGQMTLVLAGAGHGSGTSSEASPQPLAQA